MIVVVIAPRWLPTDNDSIQVKPYSNTNLNADYDNETVLKARNVEKIAKKKPQPDI